MGKDVDIDAIEIAFLKITKIEKHVMIRMRGKNTWPEEATLFVSEYSPFHTGPETIEELLNNGPLFIPVKYPDGSFRVLNRNWIYYVRELERHDRECKNNIRLYFVGNDILEAAIFEPLPKHYGRTLDFMNSGRMFLPVLIGCFRVFINRDNIIKVEEL